MRRFPLDEALTKLGRADPTFNEEVRKRLKPVKDRFFAPSSSHDLNSGNDGFHTPPAYLVEADLRKIAVELAEFALQRGIDINLACEADGSTFLHECVLLRDPQLAAEAVTWLLARGADPNRQRDDGETPFSLAVKIGRSELVGLMRDQKHS